MIIEWTQLRNLAGVVAMVDGSFDPLHDGHVAYFSEATKFGRPVLCNVTSDSWTISKHPILLPQEKRAVILDSIRYIDFVHCAKVPTRQVLAEVKPALYLKGADWLKRGGIPSEETEICHRLNIKVHYLDTVLNSSSRLIEQVRKKI